MKYVRLKSTLYCDSKKLARNCNSRIANVTIVCIRNCHSFRNEAFMLQFHKSHMSFRIPYAPLKNQSPSQHGKTVLQTSTTPLVSRKLIRLKRFYDNFMLETLKKIHHEISLSKKKIQGRVANHFVAWKKKKA